MLITTINSVFILQSPYLSQQFQARYTLFTNNDKKGTNGQNPCEPRIVCRVIRHIREYSAKNFFAKRVRRSRQFFDEIKKNFSPYFTFYNTFAKTGVYDKQCVDPFSSLFAKLNFFHEKIVSSLFANSDEQCVAGLRR